MHIWKSIGIVALGLIMGGAANAPLVAAQEAKSLAHLITNAKTPADHEAIAACYEQQAQDAHTKHAEHQKMEEQYKKNPALNKAGFGTHCDLIASSYDKTAKEYEALAKLHREMAKAAH